MPVLDLASLDIDYCRSLELGDPVDRASVSEGVMNDNFLDTSDLYRSIPQKSPVGAYIAPLSAVLYVMG